MNQKLRSALDNNNEGTYRNLVRALEDNLELIDKCKKKKIIVNKIPIDEYGDTCLEQETIEFLHDTITKSLGDDYIVFTLPTNLSQIDGGDAVLHIEDKTYTYDELIDIINKNKTKETIITGIYGIIFKSAINNIKIYDNKISSIITDSKRIIVNSPTFKTNLKIGDKGNLNIKYLLTDINNAEKEDVEFDYGVELVDIGFVAENSSNVPKDTRYTFKIIDNEFKIDEKGNIIAKGGNLNKIKLKGE